MSMTPSFARHSVRVPVKGRPYDVIVGSKMSGHLGPHLRELGLHDDVAVLTDRRVARWYLAPLVRALRRQGFRVVPIILPQGEGQKSLESASRVYSTMISRGIGRNGAVVALGGGVIGDLAGFIAATYHRGITLVQIPTTLLAQVDSSIGGKVAVNHPLGKNLIGAFYQPRVVWADVSVLRTLPRREMSCGLGEIIKYGVIRDSRFFSWLEGHVTEVLDGEEAALLRVQATCARIKARIAGADEKESGERIILNFGHTIGHALEAAGGFRTVKHGEAVLLGMKAEAWIAKEVGLLHPEEYGRICGLIERVPLFCRTSSLRESAIMAAMERDKKSVSGRKRFVLPVRVGRVRVVEGIERAVIRGSLAGILRGR